MCNTKGHDHWCSGCGKNLNKEPKDSYVEIEWSQNDNGQIIEEKSMICKLCLEESENIKELDKFFSELKYDPWGHIFCSCCKKDLTKELGDKIKSGTDYESFSFKCHERSGPNIKHIIKVVVLCQDCVKSEFNAENLTKLKKLGKNPLFRPMVTCPNTEICKQFKTGDEKVNCKNIVIGRDRETLQFGLLCGRRHKGCQLLPFDDGFAITRPRKGKGAAAAVAPVVAIDPMADYIKKIETLMKKFKFSQSTVDNNRFLAMEKRMEIIERLLEVNSGIMNHQTLTKICSIRGESEESSSGTYPNTEIISPIPDTVDGTTVKNERNKRYVCVDCPE